MSLVTLPPTQVDYSLVESSIIGLKIGRINHDCFDEQALYRQLIEGRYDFCRLKVPAEDEYAPHRLHEMGIPYFFSGSIRKYRTRIADHPTVTYLHPNLQFELYDGSQDQLLKDMLADTWGNYPLGYYRSPYMSELVTKKEELECVFQFYKKHNLNRDYPNNKIMFMKDGDNYVGIFTLNTVGDTLECNLAGILKPYRSGMYFHDEMNFKKAYCLEHNLPYFTFGARNENAAVQRIFQHLGFETAGNDNVFHLPSLLTYSQGDLVKKRLVKPVAASGSWAQVLYAECVQMGQAVLNDFKSIDVRFNHVAALNSSSEMEVEFSCPVTNGREALLVVQSPTAGAELFTGYCRLTK